MCPYKFAMVLAVLCGSIASSEKYEGDGKDPEQSVLDKVVLDCLESKAKLSCFSDKAAVAIERSMDWTIPISKGINLLRNKEVASPRKLKSLTGFKKLASAINDFFDTHTISVDLTQAEGRSLEDDSQRAGGGEGGGGGGGLGGGLGGSLGGGGLFSLNRKDLRREKKYYQYAFMVLLGIFGLTGPLVMKVLGVMAAHALLAAKAAFIIVGGVALKKLFEQDHQKPKVKVHTVPLHHESEEHDYDRMGNSFSYNYIPYQAYNAMASNAGNHPYSAYSNGEDFSPVFYGTQKKSR